MRALIHAWLAFNAIGTPIAVWCYVPKGKARRIFMAVIAVGLIGAAWYNYTVWREVVALNGSLSL